MRSRNIVLIVALSIVLAGCSGGIAAPDDPRDADSPSTTQQQTLTAANGTLTVHAINVGQGDSTLLVGPTNETMLIDTGHWEDDGEHVIEYLDRLGIDRIDHLVTTHGDADHVGGHAAVISQYETEYDGVGAVYDPGIASGSATYGEYLDAVEEHDVTLYETRENDTIPFDGVDVDVLGPPDPYLADEERNENSVVLAVTHGETSFLFTGDAGEAQERYLVDAYDRALNVTVLKAGHHGSNASTGSDLLSATDPGAVFVSSAYDSRYGHPDEETLNRLAERSIPTYWTGTHGDVVFESDGENVTVKTQRAATTSPDELRNASAVHPNVTDPVEARGNLTDAVRDETRDAPADGTDGGTPADADDGTAVDDDGTAVDADDGTAVGTDGRTEVPTGDGTRVATDGGSPTTLEVAEIHADAAGNDHENLNDEYVVFRNTGEDPLDLSGWTVSDEADHTYTFPDGFSLDPDAAVTLHTGSGADNGTDLYWGSGGAVWNNGGDAVVVTNANGERVLRETY